MSDKRLEELEEGARHLGETIAEACPPDTGFCLLLFDYVPGGWMTFISNADRQDMVQALKKLITKLEAH